MDISERMIRKPAEQKEGFKTYGGQEPFESLIDYSMFDAKEAEMMRSSECKIWKHIRDWRIDNNYDPNLMRKKRLNQFLEVMKERIRSKKGLKLPSGRVRRRGLRLLLSGKMNLPSRNSRKRPSLLLVEKNLDLTSRIILYFS